MKVLVLGLAALLSNDSFEIREGAEKALLDIHANVGDITPYLPKASRDPEAKKRLGQLRTKITKIIAKAKEPRREGVFDAGAAHLNPQ